MTALLSAAGLRRLAAALVAVALVAGAYAFWPRAHTVTVTAEFTRAVGLFPGSDVRVLGVHVGQVRSVTPTGSTVRVVLDYDASVKVPADAKAVVVAPSLVSDRYVQLLPVWTKGPALAEGAVIGVDRTAVPVELDRISASVDDLMVALGPDGANKNGALSRFIDTSAANLRGQGQNLHDTTADLSSAIQTLAEGRGDLFGTVDNLQSFTTMLAGDDQAVRRLNADLADVSDQLDGERGDLAATLKNLAVALTEVSSFVHDNRAVLRDDVAKLTTVTSAVASKRDALAETLTNAPVALSNLQNAYDPVTGTLATRTNIEQLKDPALLLCSLLSGPTGKVDSPLCTLLRATLPGLPGLPDLPGLPGLPRQSGPPGQAGLPGPRSAPGLHQADPTLGGLLPTVTP